MTMNFIIVGILMQLILLLCLVAFNSKRMIAKLNLGHLAFGSSAARIFQTAMSWLKINQASNDVSSSGVFRRDESHFSDFEIKEVVNSESEELKMLEESSHIPKVQTASTQETTLEPPCLSWLTLVTDRFKLYLMGTWWFFWQTDNTCFDDFKFDDFASRSVKDSRSCSLSANHFLLRSSLARRGKTVSPFRPNDLYAQARSRIQRKLLKLEASANRNKKTRKLAVINELPEMESLSER